VYALIEAPTLGWGAPSVIGAAGGGMAALVAFVLLERRNEQAMLPLGLFRNPDFAGANLLTLLLYAALGGGLFFFPLNLIQVQGYGATAAGAALLPFVALMFTLSRWAGSLVDRFGARGPLVVGPLIASVGFALFAWPGIHPGSQHYWTTFFPAVLVLGFGMTVTVAPLTATVMNSVGPDLAGVASGVNNAVSRAAALLAIALLGMVMAASFGHHLAKGLATAPVEVRQSVEGQRSRLAAIEAPSGADERTRALVRGAVDEAYVQGFRWVMGTSAAMALLSAFAAALMIGRGPRSAAAGARSRP
jgi:predicted MFS family arabinose efflux permease